MKTSDHAVGVDSKEVKRRHILLKALVIGCTAGLIASGFRAALQAVETARISWLQGLGTWERLPAAMAFCMIGSGFGLWLVRRFAPETAGSGIPHIKATVLGETTMNWRRIIPVKFLSGLASIGGGLALGREGPTIQMGGATGLMIAEGFRTPSGEGERRALIGAGAGAGLAAAFNAPLAGMIFVLEELEGGFAPIVFVGAFLASVSADVVCRLLTGETPVFQLRSMPAPTLSALPLAVILGLVAGVGGVVFNRCLIGSLTVFRRLDKLPSFVVGAMAGAVMGLAAWIYPGVSGSGTALTSWALNGEISIRMIVVLVTARFALTMVSYGSGAAGGIFAPLLVIGALGGLAMGNVGHLISPSWVPHREIFAVLGMGALLTAIVRAPLTGIVLMIELTGEYGFMLPLLASCFAAYGVAEAMGSLPIYEELRRRAFRTESSTAVSPPGAPKEGDGAQIEK